MPRTRIDAHGTETTTGRPESGEAYEPPEPDGMPGRDVLRATKEALTRIAGDARAGVEAGVPF